MSGRVAVTDCWVERALEDLEGFSAAQGSFHVAFSGQALLWEPDMLSGFVGSLSKFILKLSSDNVSDSSLLLLPVTR